MVWWYWIGAFALVLVLVARAGMSLLTTTLLVAAVLGTATMLGNLPGAWLWVAWGAWATFLLLPNLRSVRRVLVSAPMLRRVRSLLPALSSTERQAIDAGSVWWDANLFQGDMDWRRLLDMPAPSLTEAEQAFLDGPVEELCRMIDDWEITFERCDLNAESWAFLRKHRFFGMIIPPEYGGLGFSHQAHSEVVMKIACRSVSAAVTVMVPNSLGPAELLMHYGTEAQKNHYLPRLANGEELPSFALTGPHAGSDAGGIPDFGVVCKQVWQGRETLGFRVNWEKRYITLGPVSTLLGLAFKAYDPDHLLGEQESLGVTCALVPTDTPGVEIGQRHWPLNLAFQNGPNQGKDVFVPMDWIIGGQDGIGNGWRMLVESLSAGRGISLPALSTAAGKMAVWVTGAYARVRKQFRMPIGQFEGVQEALGRMAGLAYLMDASRTLTLSAMDQGERPSVLTGIVKYQLTEYMRQVVDDAMDIHGGRGIMMGPSNYLGRVYQSVPIGITVEGANILTRSMIIFGQGAMRCHPYLVREILAASEPDHAQAQRDFDTALFGHIGYAITNGVRSLLYGLTRGYLAPVPDSAHDAAYYRRLARLSASFALLADVALLFLGGALKRREMLSGRFADALIHLYTCSASLKRYHDAGRPAAHRNALQWACEHSLYQVQMALDGILRNFPSRVLALPLRALVFPLGLRIRPPCDSLTRRLAKEMMRLEESRDEITRGVFVDHRPGDAVGRLEHALRLTLAAEPLQARLHEAGQDKPTSMPLADWLQELHTKGVINAEQRQLLEDYEAAVRAAIMVDDFEPAFMAHKSARHAAA